MSNSADFDPIALIRRTVNTTRILGSAITRNGVYILLDIAEAAREETEHRVCDRVPEYTMKKTGEPWPECGQCHACKLKTALRRLGVTVNGR